MTAGFVWLAISAGLLSVLTPCVFPMIPVTVAWFSKAQGPNGRIAIREALLFGAGIVTSFTALGLTLAAVFGAAGLNRFAANPWFNLVLAFVFLVFSGNLFGWYEISVPYALLSRADKAAGSRSGSGAATLVAGALFTLTTVTCTAPFVGTLLVLAAGGSWTAPLMGMLLFSTAFALPFVILAAMPSLLARKPASGAWLRTLRISVGFLEVAAAVKFLSNADMVEQWGILTRSVVIVLWAFLAGIAAVILLRRSLVAPSTGSRFRISRFAPALSAAVLTAWLAAGARGRSLGGLEAFLPPVSSEGISSNNRGTRQEWILNDHETALTRAKSTGRLVLIDFSGYTCTNCRWMEANIFAKPAVSAELSNFVLSRLYTDGDGELYERQQQFQESTFGTVALPLYAVVDAEGRTRSTLGGLTRDPAEFVAFLRAARGPRVATR